MIPLLTNSKKQVTQSLFSRCFKTVDVDYILIYIHMYVRFYVRHSTGQYLFNTNKCFCWKDWIILEELWISFVLLEQEFIEVESLMY